MNIHTHPLNKETIKQAADFLILTNGQTTTLEVKNLLRQQKYRAFQKEISYYLEQIAIEQDWNAICNGVFRTYSYSTTLGGFLNGDNFGFSLN